MQRFWIKLAGLLGLLLLVGSGCTPATTTTTNSTTLTSAAANRQFDHFFLILFENHSRDQVLANPYFAHLASLGVQLTNYYGVSHPSQPNYIALIAGDPLVADDAVHNLPQTNLVDLLDHAGVSWKAYEESYPSQCFAESGAGNSSVGLYVRSHNPFISFDDIRTQPERCNQIVSADQLSADIAARRLPAVSFYVPNKNDDMHDTSVAYGAQWLQRFLDPKLADPNFFNRTVVMVAFDEIENKKIDPASQPLYAVLLGPLIKPGSTDATRYNHYSVLRTIEDNFQVGSLQRNDAGAAPFAACNFTGGCG